MCGGFYFYEIGKIQVGGNNVKTRSPDATTTIIYIEFINRPA